MNQLRQRRSKCCRCVGVMGVWTSAAVVCAQQQVDVPHGRSRRRLRNENGVHKLTTRLRLSMASSACVCRQMLARM